MDSISHRSSVVVGKMNKRSSYHKRKSHKVRARHHLRKRRTKHITDEKVEEEKEDKDLGTPSEHILHKIMSLRDSKHGEGTGVPADLVDAVHAVPSRDRLGIIERWSRFHHDPNMIQVQQHVGPEVWHRILTGNVTNEDNDKIRETFEGEQLPPSSRSHSRSHSRSRSRSHSRKSHSK